MIDTNLKPPCQIEPVVLKQNLLAIAEHEVFSYRMCGFVYIICLRCCCECLLPSCDVVLLSVALRILPDRVIRVEVKLIFEELIQLCCGSPLSIRFKVQRRIVIPPPSINTVDTRVSKALSETKAKLVDLTSRKRKQIVKIVVILTIQFRLTLRPTFNGDFGWRKGGKASDNVVDLPLTLVGEDANIVL